MQGHAQPAMSASMQLAPSTLAPSQARRNATDMMRRWQLRDEDIQTAELLISELVTNAVKFAASGHPPAIRTDDRIRLELAYSPGKLTVAVTDPSPDTPVVGRPGTDAENGRGMMLVAALSLEWAWHDLPDGGKTVYCVIAVEHDASRLPVPLLSIDRSTP
jgi:anti-sigma regulatory factor (Ser/Thr protein kinase)